MDTRTTNKQCEQILVHRKSRLKLDQPHSDIRHDCPLELQSRHTSRHSIHYVDSKQRKQDDLIQNSSQKASGHVPPAPLQPIHFVNFWIPWKHKMPHSLSPSKLGAVHGLGISRTQLIEHASERPPPKAPPPVCPMKNCHSCRLLSHSAEKPKQRQQ